MLRLSRGALFEGVGAVMLKWTIPKWTMLKRPVLKRRNGLTLPAGSAVLVCLFFVPAGASAASATSLNETGSETRKAILRPSEQMNDYRDAISRLEAEQGPWSRGLAEQLSGLGQSYQTRGYHRDAIEIFRRAVHVSRINNGLYALNQVPIIEHMLESLKARGRWDEVHKRHQYLYWLHQRNYGADDPRMLPVIDKLGKWYINDYALNPQRRMMNQLVDAYDLFEQAINIITGTYGEQDLRMIEPLRGLVMSNWFFANYTGENYTSEMEKAQLTRDLGMNDVRFPEPERSNRITQYLRNNYADGKQAIETMVQIYSSSSDSPPGAAAKAKVELADWEQLFSHRHSAEDLYREAWRELSANEATRDEAKKLFGQPVALPDLGLVESELEGPADLRRANEIAAGEPVSVVLASYDVNRFGEAVNIDILDSSPAEDKAHRKQVRQTLENTRFRPRLVNGEPANTDGMTQKFVFTGE